MADISPLSALHYDLGRTGGLAPVVAPPYDVIDAAAARGAARPLAVQRRRDRPAAGRATRTRTPPRTLARLARRRRRRRRRRARAVGARAGLHRARRAPPHPPRHLRARARRGLRPGPDPPARAHAPRPEGGPAAAHARDAREPLADLLALRRRRLDRRSRRTCTGAPLDDVTDEDGTTHRLVARRRPGRDRGRAGGARARRAADRRRPPPLRDRARLRAGAGRAGGRRPRADVPRLARRPGPDDLPHAPPADRPRRRARGSRCATRSSATGTSRRSRSRSSSRRPPPTAASASATSTPTTAARCGSRSRTRRSPTPRCPASPRPTAGSTPR